MAKKKTNKKIGKKVRVRVDWETSHFTGEPLLFIQTDRMNGKTRLSEIYIKLLREEVKYPPYYYFNAKNFDTLYPTCKHYVERCPVTGKRIFMATKRTTNERSTTTTNSSLNLHTTRDFRVSFAQ